MKKLKIIRSDLQTSLRTNYDLIKLVGYAKSQSKNYLRFIVATMLDISTIYMLQITFFLQFSNF